MADSVSGVLSSHLLNSASSPMSSLSLWVRLILAKPFHGDGLVGVAPVDPGWALGVVADAEPIGPEMWDPLYRGGLTANGDIGQRELLHLLLDADGLVLGIVLGLPTLEEGLDLQPPFIPGSVDHQSLADSHHN